MRTRRLLTITKPKLACSLAARGQGWSSRQIPRRDIELRKPGAFFGRRTERRWALVTALQGPGAMAVCRLTGRAGRDVKRVHEDVQVLTELDLVARDDAGVLCRFAHEHIDMHIHAESVAA